MNTANGFDTKFSAQLVGGSVLTNFHELTPPLELCDCLLHSELPILRCRSKVKRGASHLLTTTNNIRFEGLHRCVCITYNLGFDRLNWPSLISRIELVSHCFEQNPDLIHILHTKRSALGKKSAQGTHLKNTHVKQTHNFRNSSYLNTSNLCYIRSVAQVTSLNDLNV